MLGRTDTQSSHAFGLRATEIVRIATPAATTATRLRRATMAAMRSGTGVNFNMVRTAATDPETAPGPNNIAPTPMAIQPLTFPPTIAEWKGWLSNATNAAMATRDPMPAGIRRGNTRSAAVGYDTIHAAATRR